MKRKRSPQRGKIRYAVIGLGDITQGAVLPGFQNAEKNSELVALVSDDPKKLRHLAKHYHVPHACHYDQLDRLMQSGSVDAVYIALPNSLHREFAIRAAEAGVHVLCEKPLAVTESDCQDMIRACKTNRVKLMTAYRLHFERTNLEAIRLLQEGRIGELRIFQSVFTMQVKAGNVRLQKALGGGTLYDIGIYCINAARYLFRSEPTEVIAVTAKNDDPRFREVDEMTTAIMQFPQNRLASFTTSFGAADAAEYVVVGTKGLLRLKHGYEYSQPMEMELTVADRTKRRSYALSDQFGPEILYFSDCILNDREPGPSGFEGLADVRIIRSLYESARHRRPVRIRSRGGLRRPDLGQSIRRPRVKHPAKVRAESPHR
ncbi:MAG: Gfo/Idh/MocA family oxidoreductase [Verrucomicrobiales bacterium]|nr:Gfo/Idh/MocA family oxidoreductase [Verrucomicrobiales bacterium]